MARSKRLEIVIAGDASGANRALGSIEGRLGKTGRSFGRFGRAAALGIGAVAVAGAAVVVSVGRDLMNMERLMAQTETVIRSTGGAANVSADEVAAMGQSIQDLTGIQQESVMEGENLLLTFTNIQNAAGNGPQIFDRATQAMVDMSVAMGTDMSSASMLVGKALNDPIRGLASLTRVGVQFTDQQRDTIASMVESGDVAGAQAVILDELGREFGGSAAAFGETTAGQFARAKEQLGDLAEGIVIRLMPAITTAVEWFREKAIPALSDFADWVGPRLTAAFDTAVSWVRANWPQIKTTVLEVFNTIVGWVRANWPQIESVITSVLTRVQGVITSVVGFIQTVWAAFGDDLMAHVGRVWPEIRNIIEGALRVIQGIINTVSALIRGDWGEVWNGIKQIVSGAWQFIQGAIRNAINTARTLMGMGWQVIKNLTQSAWNGIKNVVRSGVDAVMGFIRSIPGRVGAIASHAWDSLVSSFRTALNTIIGWWNGLSVSFDGYDIPGPGPNIPGFTVDFPNLPTLAEGGIVTSPTLALVGEAGPEAVIPLGRSGGMGNTLTINIYGDADAQAIGKVEAAVKKGLPTPQLDRKIRRLAGAR